MARKSRADMAQASGSQQTTWHVGLYIRLSREDTGQTEDSQSVKNQESILRAHFAAMKDGDEYIIENVYVDDGISGTTDEERPRFLSMLHDIQNGKINCVAVKDLARNFRNYSDQGYYLDDWFPRHHVRFISLYHQTLDSHRDPKNMRNIAVPIQGVINENHCAETSEKVRAVFDLKRRRGDHIGSFAPYGYQKHPENKNVFIVDESAAAVVRKIYTMFLDGYSKNAIVRSLNDQGLPCPSRYKREVLGLRYANPNAVDPKHVLWSAQTITTILKNRMYCGDMVQGRYRIKSYKLHIQERVPPAEWYIVEDTHPAIIDRRSFAAVQSLLMRDTRTKSQQSQPYLFSGFLQCADCGKSMTRSQVKNRVYYYCRTYKDYSKSACSKHSISHEKLENAVLSAICMQLDTAVCHGSVCEHLRHAAQRATAAEQLADGLRYNELRQKKILHYQQLLWQDWKEQHISQAEYQFMHQDFAAQLAALAQTIATEKRELASCNHVSYEDPLLSDYEQHGKIHTLDRSLLAALVTRITVHEGGKIVLRFAFSDPQGPRNRAC